MPSIHIPSIQESELVRLTQARDAEMKFLKEQNEVEVKKTRDMCTIETDKFKNMVDAIGAGTLQAIATAGPEMQVSSLWLLTVDRLVVVTLRPPVKCWGLDISP